MPTLLDNMMSEVYRKPHIINFVQLLLRARSEINLESSSNVYTVEVPKRFANKEFDECFAHFICRGALCIAIFRSPGGTLRSEQPYVYTNPRPDTRLSKRDKIMLICSAEAHRAFSDEDARAANGKTQASAVLGMMSPIVSTRNDGRGRDGSSGDDESDTSAVEKMDLGDGAGAGAEMSDMFAKAESKGNGKRKKTKLPSMPIIQDVPEAEDVSSRRVKSAAAAEEKRTATKT